MGRSTTFVSREQINRLRLHGLRTRVASDAVSAVLPGVTTVQKLPLASIPSRRREAASLRFSNLSFLWSRPTGGGWVVETCGYEAVAGLTVKQLSRERFTRAKTDAARRLPRLTKFLGRERLQAA